MIQQKKGNHTRKKPNRKSENVENNKIKWKIRYTKEKREKMENKRRKIKEEDEEGNEKRKNRKGKFKEEDEEEK